MVILTEDTKRNVGQQFVCGFHGFELSEDIKTLIRDYHVGNVILMKRNIRNARQARELVQDLQRFAKESGHKKPLLIGIDQENGLVSAFSSPTAGTQFPGAMAIAATGSAELAEEVAAATGKELRMAGINWVYSPVADVNTDSRNPVIGVRSFGNDPAKVALFASAVSRGLLSERVAPTAKHFPGHGDTHIDSHLALPRIMKTKEQILQEELVPFQTLVDSGIPCIMTGHMALPLITGEDTPCSLSRAITTTLLKDEMKFKGVIVTDCLEMDAIAEPQQGGCGVEVGALRAVEAGADIVMICHTFQKQKGAVEQIYQALEGNQLSPEDLSDSVLRISAMKDRIIGGWEEVLRDDLEWDKKFSTMQEKHLQLSLEAYSKSTTILWNKTKVIPLNVNDFKDGKQLLLFTPEVERINLAVDSSESSDGIIRGKGGVVRNTAGASYLAFSLALAEKVPLKHVVYSGLDQIDATAFDGLAGVIFVMRNADVKRWQLEYLERLGLWKLNIPVVLISSCGPYDLNDRGEWSEWAGYVATYEFTAEALRAAVGTII